MTATNMCSNFDGFRCSPPFNRSRAKDRDMIRTKAR